MYHTIFIMPGRKTPLVTGNYYHIYNRGVAKQPTFTNKTECNRALELINYYRFANIKQRYSKFIALPSKEKSEIWQHLKRDNKIYVQIISFVLMPNHFHFCLKQVVDNGISRFVSQFTNSYTRYINTIKNRPGTLFQGRFKAILVDSDEQLIHLTRYHHLNPYTDGLQTNIKDLITNTYSSLPDYISEKTRDFIDTSDVLAYFKNRLAYKKFVMSHRDYQKKLGKIKHLLFEKVS